MPKSVQLKDKDGRVFPYSYYQVGDLYLTTRSENPSVRYGGTWSLFGEGRTLVGVDTSQSEFNTVKKTGGSKYLQDHSHGISRTFSNASDGTDNDERKILAGRRDNSWTNNATTHNVLSVQTGDSGNLQPYVTCYIWLRIK